MAKPAPAISRQTVKKKTTPNVRRGGAFEGTVHRDLRRAGQDLSSSSTCANVFPPADRNIQPLPRYWRSLPHLDEQGAIGSDADCIGCPPGRVAVPVPRIWCEGTLQARGEPQVLLPVGMRNRLGVAGAGDDHTLCRFFPSISTVGLILVPSP